MSSLVLELQTAASDSKVSVTELLRMALIVATKLDIKKFREWIELELKGYKDKRPPEYRKITGAPVAFNRYRGWERVLLHQISPELAERMSTFYLEFSVAEIESGLGDKKAEAGMWLITYSKRAEISFMQSLNYPAIPAVHIAEGQFNRVLNAVRNIILEWSLALEKDGILGEGMTFSKDEQKKATDAKFQVGTYVENMSYSQIQQGTTDSTQTMTIQADNREQILKVISDLKKHRNEISLAPEQEQMLDADMKTIETQLTLPTPKSVIIYESLHSIRNVLEGATGSLMANGILYGIMKLLGHT